MSQEEALLEIQGMHCMGCSANIEHYLRRLEGVRRAKVDFKTRRATIAFDRSMITLDQIVTSAIFCEPSNFIVRLLEPGNTSISHETI